MSPRGPAQRPWEVRRGEVERAQSVQGQVFRVPMFIDLASGGETLVEVNFPVWFIEKPNVGSGSGELAPNEVLEDGNYPRWNVGVKEWRTDQQGGVGGVGVLLYKGAILIVVAEGPPTMRSTAHCSFTGRALRNPLIGAGGMDEPI